MEKKIFGLDRFGLTQLKFAKLTSRTAHIRVHLRTWDLTPDVIARSAKTRKEYLQRRWDRWWSLLKKQFPHLRLKPDSKQGNMPWSLSIEIPTAEIKSLMALACVSSICVQRLDGYRAKRLKKSLSWFCVRARVAIQVEDQRSGLQTTEDRFVIVKAKSAEDAKKRLKKEWQAYALPGMNKFGYLFRWQMEAITDIYETLENEILPTGTEVYSKLSERRLKGLSVWTPRRAKKPRKRRK